MALLDVSLVLFDPDLTDPVVVIRRKEVVTAKGRATTENIQYPIMAVVTSNNPNDLNRQDPDLETASRTISVITNFKVRGQTEGYLPDIVFWRGDNFVVSYIDLYPQFGIGFYQVVCTSMDRNDMATVSLNYGQLSFNSTVNTQYIGMISQC